MNKTIETTERIIKALATARIHVGEARKEAHNGGGFSSTTSPQYNAIENAVKALESALRAFSSEQ